MTHYENAVRALEEADRIANSDSGAYGDDRQVIVANYLARAQVHATFALAEATDNAGNAAAKAVYDGRI